ncbi:MAG: IS1380 family transposase [Candidatus Glassbacteria bacterium]|nr:IS1380 family transposase [Candidatus Glassbacteria bacterium]
MTNRNREELSFPRCKGRKVEADFSGGNVTSDGGVLLVRAVDRRLGLTAATARLLSDPRRQASCEHTVLSMLRQRVYGLAAGYEDLNDHDSLRHDLAWQTAVERDRPSASSPTLCRLENRADRQAAVAMHRVLAEQFIASHSEPPTELILDFDATDDPVHGKQEGRFFHGYYDHYCFLPLYVTCRDQLLVAYLRPSNIDGAKHAWAILALLVKRLRQAWPGVRIVFRADSGFCRWRMLRWCDNNEVFYIVGLAKNTRINKLAAPLIDKARKGCETSKRKQRLFGNLRYGAHGWDRQRRVIARIEHSVKGSNPRYVVTNLPGNPKKLYERVYCQRGEMENRIKEQMQLFSDRTSATHWWPNQFRLLLSALAYVLLETIRRLGLKGTELARAQVATIRLKLLKIGAVILRNTRRVRFLLASAHPYQHPFQLAAARLKPG